MYVCILYNFTLGLPSSRGFRFETLTPQKKNTLTCSKCIRKPNTNQWAWGFPRSRSICHLARMRAAEARFVGTGQCPCGTNGALRHITGSGC